MSLAHQDRARRGREVSDDDISTEVPLEELIEAARGRWPLLTENDLLAVQGHKDAHKDALLVGNYEGLVGRMRERYRLSESEAQHEVDRFMQGFLVAKSTRREHSSNGKMIGGGRV